MRERERERERERRERWRWRRFPDLRRSIGAKRLSSSERLIRRNPSAIVPRGLHQVVCSRPSQRFIFLPVSRAPDARRRRRRRRTKKNQRRGTRVDANERRPCDSFIEVGRPGDDGVASLSLRQSGLKRHGSPSDRTGNRTKLNRRRGGKKKAHK